MKTKLYSIAMAFSLVFVASVAFAATTDFVANGDITVSSVPGDGVTANLTILNGSKAESWVYNNGLNVTNPDSTNTFNVTSDDANVLSIGIKGSDGKRQVCVNSNDSGFSSIATPSASDTYGIYPSSVRCDPAGSGGAGGGSTSFGPTTPIAQATPATISCPPGALFDSNTGAACSTFQTQNQNNNGNIPSGFKFTRAIKSGIAGSDVQNLQKFLNSHGFVISASGAGSSGKETTTFGPLTKRAVIKFQITKDIIKSASDVGAGLVGPKTRAAINAMLDK